MRIQFGAGTLYFNPNGGNVPTLQTPQICATLQDVTIDLGATIKDLRGQLQYPDDTAISDRKITWKTGFGRMDIDMYNNIVFGETAIATGGQTQSVQEQQTIPSTNPTTITITNSTKTPLKDLGVQYAATGQKFTLVTVLNNTGQYMFNASTGVYTFFIDDASTKVLIS